MKYITILILQICGLAFIVACPLSILNYYFDLHMAIKGQEVPSDSRFAASVLILGIAVSLVGWLLNKRFVPQD